MIKAIITDVDGVLTDGKINYIHINGIVHEIKSFNVKDGQAFNTLKNKHLIKTGIITKRYSPVTKYRAEELNMTFIYQNSGEKLEVYEQIKKSYNLLDEEICYIGDDIPDINVLNIVGFSVCPKDANRDVKEIVDYVSMKNGGDGVILDVYEYLLNNKLIN